MNTAKKEIQSIDSLTQKEMNVYEKAKELKKSISSDKINSFFYGIMSIGETTYAALSLYATQVQNSPTTENPYLIAFGAALGIIGIVGYGSMQRHKGQCEQELYDIVNKREYKKAEKVMSQNYEK
jgi:hypothetical protein